MADPKRLTELTMPPPLAEEVANQIQAMSSEGAAAEAIAAAAAAASSEQASQMNASDAAFSRDSAAQSANAAQLAAETAALGSNYKQTLAQALAEVPVGQAFICPEVTAENPNGEDRRYIRVTDPPGYELTADQPISKNALAAPDGADLIGAPEAGTLDDRIKWLTPEAYGAIGNGSALNAGVDTFGVQQAVTMAYTLGYNMQARPGANYQLNAEITSPTNKVMKLCGYTNNGAAASTFTAVAGFTGWLFRPGASYDIRDIALRGNNTDGCYLIGNNTDSGAGAARIERVSIADADIGIFFDALWEHPFGLYYNQIIGTNFRTSGICLGGRTGAAGSGESSWSMDNILLNAAPNAVGISAPGVTVVPNTTDGTTPSTTRDYISWTNTAVPMFGWCVMRSANGTTGWHPVPNFYQPYFAGANFSAQKSVGETWNYAVVRQTRGVSIRRGKGISLGVVQAEYFGWGVFFEDSNAASINNTYSEIRDRVPPLPMMASVVAVNSSLTLGGGWVEGYGYGVVSYANSRVSIDGEYRMATRYGIGGLGGSTLQSMKIFGSVIALGTTPDLIVNLDGGAQSYIKTRSRQDNATGASIIEVDGTAQSRFDAYNRGILKASLGTDASGDGYATMQRLTVTAPNKIVKPKFIHDAATAKTTALTIGTATNFLTIAGMTTGQTASLSFNYHIIGNDGNNRQVVAGSVKAAISYIGANATVSLAPVVPAKALQAGTASDPVFTPTSSGGTITLQCAFTTSMTQATIAVDCDQAMGAAPATLTMTQL